MARSETSAELGIAVAKAAGAYGLLESGEVIGDFIIVAATQRIDEDDEVEHSYITMVRDGLIASTSAIGLLETASFDIKRTGRLL